jgi:hypothetical protein
MDISLVFRRGVYFSTFTGPGPLNFSKTISAVFTRYVADSCLCGTFCKQGLLAVGQVSGCRNRPAFALSVA